MANQHPSTEQLAGYLDAPESNTHSDVRHHLMGCNQCRVRIDQLTQLELDIKHYAPRFVHSDQLTDDAEQILERYLDHDADNESGDPSANQFTSNQQKHIEQQLMSNPAALKAALHYALHNNTMRRDIDPAYSGATNAQPTAKPQKFNALTQFLDGIRQRLQQPMPLWAMAPASLLVAVVIGFAVLSLNTTQQSTVQIAAYQDDPTITFQRIGAPAGSIGFFHDAQTQRKAFSGMTITSNQDGGNVAFNWVPVTNAKTYRLEVYTATHNEKQLLASQSSAQPTIILSDLNLTDQQHYHWQLSGETTDNMTFTTQGDFLYLGSLNRHTN